MKLLINDYYGLIPDVQRLELPANSEVVYLLDDGNRFRVQPSKDGNGLQISILEGGLVIRPRVSNVVEVRPE